MRWRRARAPGPFPEYLCIVLRPTESRYGVVRIQGGRPIDSFQHHGHKYGFAPERAFKLKGWYPWMKQGYWSTFAEVVDWHKTGLLVYREPEDPLHGIEIPVPPMDRARPVTLQSPLLLHGIAQSPLYRNYQRRRKIGSSNTVLMIAIIALGIMVAVAIVIMTGGL
jgi:hypothetical protein